LISYDCPGNVRELENAVERAVVFTNTKLVQLSVLPQVMPAFAESRTFDISRTACGGSNWPGCWRRLAFAPTIVYRSRTQVSRGYLCRDFADAFARLFAESAFMNLGGCRHKRSIKLCRARLPCVNHSASVTTAIFPSWQ
jgi:hypothetical protein